MSFETLGKYEKVYQIQGIRKPKKLKQSKTITFIIFSNEMVYIRSEVIWDYQFLETNGNMSKYTIYKE